MAWCAAGEKQYRHTWSVQIWSVQIWSVQIWSVQIWSVQIWSVQIWSVQIWSVQIWSVQIWSVQLFVLRPDTQITLQRGEAMKITSNPAEVHPFRVVAWWASGRTGFAKCDSAPNA